MSGSDRSMARDMNPYLRDAPFFLKRAIEGIAQEEDGPDNISHALHLALGVERLLKGILWKEHPGYTLTDESFQNMARVFHADRLKEIGGEKKEGNADSVTYRTAVTRARVFSNSTHQHIAVLMKLGHQRDVIAHNDLALIDLKDLAFFLRRNLHPLITAFSAELLVDEDLMGKHEPLLGKMAVDYIVDLEARVTKRLAHHMGMYRHRATPVEYAFPGIAKSTSDQIETAIDCPACGQKACVREEVDFDYVDRHAVPMGVYIVHLRCPHCRLFVEDYEELEMMGITTETLHPSYED